MPGRGPNLAAMTTKKKQDKPQTEVEDAAVAEVFTEDVVAVEPRPEEIEPLRDAEEHAAVPAEEEPEGLPDHLTPRISLEEYAGLRPLTPFQRAALTRAIGDYSRSFEVWEESRQQVLGG